MRNSCLGKVPLFSLLLPGTVVVATDGIVAVGDAGTEESANPESANGSATPPAA